MDAAEVVDGAVVEAMVVTMVEAVAVAVAEDEVGKDVVEIGTSTCQT